MLVAQIGLAFGLAIVSPDGDIAYRDTEWIEAVVTCVAGDEAVVVDVDGWTFTIDADGWTEGDRVLIVEDDGEIEDIKRPDEYH